MTAAPRRDLARTTLAVLAIGGLIIVSLWILKPFLPALIWATMIVVATWPLLLGLQRRLWGRRWLAVSVLMLMLLLIFVLPFSLAIAAVVANAEEIAGWAKSLSTLTLPAPPDWLKSLPVVGERLHAAWRDIAASGPEELARLATPYAREAMHWFAAEVGSFGLMAVQFLLTVVLAAVLYFWGEAGAEKAHRFGRRLAGERGERAISLAGRAIRAVAFGVVLTALAQSILGGIGLAVAGVPFAGILTSLMFLLALAQIGAVPVLLCAAAWLYWKGSIGWTVALVVWSVVVGSLDNVLRPMLIRQGANLSLLLIFAGVIGGLIAFGLVGIFVGPVVLAVGYTLLDAWMHEDQGGTERTPQ
jgi:predicted PurR-regulated permease PerM